MSSAPRFLESGLHCWGACHSGDGGSPSALSGPISAGPGGELLSASGLASKRYQRDPSDRRLVASAAVVTTVHGGILKSMAAVWIGFGAGYRPSDSAQPFGSPAADTVICPSLFVLGFADQFFINLGMLDAPYSAVSATSAATRSITSLFVGADSRHRWQELRTMTPPARCCGHHPGDPGDVFSASLRSKHHWSFSTNSCSRVLHSASRRFGHAGATSELCSCSARLRSSLQ